MTKGKHMTQTRSDVHSPTSLVTENYDYVGGYDNQGYYGVMDADGTASPAFTERARLRGLIARALTTAYHNGNQCDHCGAAIRYVAVVKHTPTGDHLAIGETCLDNRFGQATVDFQRMRKAAQLDTKASKIRSEWDAYKAEHGTQAEWDALYASANTFVQDVLAKGARYGNLSEKQLSAITNAVKRDAEKASLPAEVTLPVPEGKGVVIKGEVLTTKWQDTYYGETLKMLVKVTIADSSYKVWGTVPSALDVSKGDVVRFTAQVEASKDDPSFGFFKRPAKASIVTKAVVAEAEAVLAEVA